MPDEAETEAQMRALYLAVARFGSEICPHGGAVIVAKWNQRTTLEAMCADGSLPELPISAGYFEGREGAVEMALMMAITARATLIAIREMAKKYEMNQGELMSMFTLFLNSLEHGECPTDLLMTIHKTKERRP